MLYVPKIDDYLKILSDEEVKDFVAINFIEYFNSIREAKNLRKVAKSLYIFLATPDEVEKYVQSNSSDICIHHYNVESLNLFDPELQLINTKSMIKNKLKELLSDMKKFRVQTVLVLNYDKRNDHKIFHSSVKLITSDSDIDKAFISMHQRIMTKIKKYAYRDWIVLDVIIRHSITVVNVSIRRKNSMKWR